GAAEAGRGRARRPDRPRAGTARNQQRPVGEQAPRLPPGAMRGSTASIVASPVLVGAVTVLVVIVGVFLAYNANNGLPFVPTYDLKAQLPSGANLVRDNEVRVGGFRVRLVDKIAPQYDPQLPQTI